MCTYTSSNTTKQVTCYHLKDTKVDIKTWFTRSGNETVSLYINSNLRIGNTIVDTGVSLYGKSPTHLIQT